MVKTLRLRLVGHMLKQLEDRSANAAMNWSLEDGKKQEADLNTWRTTLSEDLQGMDVTWRGEKKSSQQIADSEEISSPNVLMGTEGTKSKQTIPYGKLLHQRRNSQQNEYLRQVLETLGCGNWTRDVAYFGDGFDGRHVRPERRVANDNELVVVAKGDAVHVRVGNHVRVQVRAAEQARTASCSVHTTVLHAGTRQLKPSLLALDIAAIITKPNYIVGQCPT